MFCILFIYINMQLFKYVTRVSLIILSGLKFTGSKHLKIWQSIEYYILRWNTEKNEKNQVTNKQEVGKSTYIV